MDSSVSSHPSSSPSSRSAEDLALVQRILAGDASAEREFYEANVDGVYRLAYRMTSDPELARDFTQEAFVRAFNRLEQFRGEAAVSTWLRRVAMSVIMNGLERTRGRQARETSLEEVEAEAPPMAMESLELHERLSNAIAALPVSQRGVIMMHDIEGFTHQEIADALGITVSSSKVRLFRARAQLRLALADFAEEWSS